MLLMLLLLAAQTCRAAEKPLTGRVNATRIPRPASPLQARTGTALQPSTAVQNNDFKVGTQQSIVDSQLSAVNSEPLTPATAPFTSSPPFQSGLSNPPRSGTVPYTVPTSTPPPSSSGGAAAPPIYDYSRKPRSDYKKMVIRLKRFRGHNEMEVVWEASRMANRMLKKGAQVTILLDMEAVHAIDKNETAGAYTEANRGNGNSAAAKLTSPQDHLMEFVQNGGRLVASQRWVKLFAIGSGSLLPGTNLISEDEMDEILLDPDATVVDY